MGISTVSNESSAGLPVIVVGAGLAGLSCAFELAERRIPTLLLEAAPFWAAEPLPGSTTEWRSSPACTSIWAFIELCLLY